MKQLRTTQNFTWMDIFAGLILVIVVFAVTL